MYENVEKYLDWVRDTFAKEIPKLEDDLRDKFMLDVEDVLRGGKRFRPALALLSAQAIAGEEAWKDSIDYAIAVEMIHSFSLNIDDILDADEMRRGKPSEWVMFGLIPAFLAGIGGITQAFALGSNNHKAMKVLNETIQAMASGAVKEMVSGNVFKRDFLLNIIILKTGALMATASQMGAIAVNAPSNVEEAFRKYGLYTGIAYQMQDDLNDILLSMQDSTPHGDLKSYRLTMPLYILHESTPSLGDAIDLFLDRKISFSHLSDKLIAAGGVKLFSSVNDEIENYVGKAIHSINGLNLDDEYKQILQDLPYYMINKMKAELVRDMKQAATLKKAKEEEKKPELEEKKDNTLPYDEWLKTLPPRSIAAVSLMQVGVSDEDIINKTSITEKELNILKTMYKMYQEKGE